MTRSGLKLFAFAQWLLVAMMFSGLDLAAADTSVQTQARPELSKPSQSLNSGPRTQPRIVPVDPFVTNLLARPQIHLSGLGLDIARHPSSTFSRLFRWNEAGAFRVVSKNYSPENHSGASRGFAVFRIEFP